jgi:hypothetical protein
MPTVQLTIHNNINFRGENVEAQHGGGQFTEVPKAQSHDYYNRLATVGQDEQVYEYTAIV